MAKTYFRYVVTFMLAFGVVSFSAYAQESASPVVTTPVLEDSSATSVAPAPAEVPQKPAAAATDVPVKANIEVESLRSVLFTNMEYQSLQQAKSYRGMVRAPTEGELQGSFMTPAQKIKPPPEEREIKLGGIVYKSRKDWTIWLNGKRVTPTALPKEALDVKVTKDYVEIKWFDDYTNQIFPLRLRPHQRFNIDTRIFLPG